MEDVKLKLFLWDQFVRPFHAITEMWFLKIIASVLIFLALVTKHYFVTLVLLIILILMLLLETLKYYKSGEYIKHYRDFKSEQGKYSDYKKIVKEFKKGKTIDEELKEVEGAITNESLTGIEEKNEQSRI